MVLKEVWIWSQISRFQPRLLCDPGKGAAAKSSQSLKGEELTPDPTPEASLRKHKRTTNSTEAPGAESEEDAENRSCAPNHK